MRVLITGTFDMLHSGHVKFFKEAAKFGDLCVGIGSDYSIKKYKGREPVCTEAERLFMVEAIRYVKKAWINSGEGPMDFVEEIEHAGIHVLVVNEDQDMQEKELLCEDLGIVYIVLKRETEPGLPVRSTTSYRQLSGFDKDYGL